MAEFRFARITRLVSIPGLVCLLACEDDAVLPMGPEPGPSGRLDAGSSREVGSIEAGAPDNGSLRPDLLREDSGVLDDAGEDAGFEPSCTCPLVPNTCPSLRSDQSRFSPSADQGLLLGLFEALACAEDRLRVAIYEADWDCAVDAMAARLAADPDLLIELVIDDDRCRRVAGVLSCALSTLDGHPRVAIVDDARSRLMHHKFVLVDDRFAWVSSANFTRRSFCTDLNNSVLLEQPEIFAGYEAEFDRLFTDRQFGPVATASTATISGGVYTLYFGPESPISQPARWFDALVRAIDDANSSVELMIAAWTRTEISDALLRARLRGVVVRGIVGHPYIDEAPAQALLAAQIPLKKASVHSKVLIVDQALVVTGSPNWSQNSWENNENSLFIRDPTIARAFLTEFERAFLAAAVP